MIEVLSESTPKASKDYPCQACRFLLDGGLRDVMKGPLTFAEKRAIAQAKANGYKILKGQTYLRQNNVDQGEFYVFKAIPAVHDIMIKYKLYPDF